MLVFKNNNLFHTGLLDVDDALPNLESVPDTPEANNEITQAEFESVVLEKEIEKTSEAIAEGGEIVDNLEALEEKHSENLENNPDMSSEEVSENLNELREGVESVAGIYKVSSREELYAALGIRNYTFGLNSITSLTTADYKEGIEGVKMLFSTIWHKIKIIFQRFVQWIQKWITKALVWIKGYSRKAEKLEKEAKEIKDDSELKIDGLSSLAKLLAKNQAGTIESILEGEKKLNEASNTIQKITKEGMNKANKETNGKSGYKISDEGIKLIGESVKFFLRADANKSIVENVKDYNTSVDIFIGVCSREEVYVAVTDIEEDVFRKTITEYKKKKFDEITVPTKKGSDVKKVVLDVCKDSKTASKKIQEMLSKSENQFRDFLKKFSISSKGDDEEVESTKDFVKFLMQLSTLTQKILVTTAYTPGHYLAAASELVKACK